MSSQQQPIRHLRFGGRHGIPNLGSGKLLRRKHSDTGSGIISGGSVVAFTERPLSSCCSIARIRPALPHVRGWGILR